MEEAKFPELQFSRGYALDNNKQILIVTQRHLAYHPPFGYVSRAQITFQEDGSYTVHILMRVLQNGVAQDESEVHELLKRFSATSTYKFCPGIEWSYYHEQYFEAIRFDIKSVCRMEAPFYHIGAASLKARSRMEAPFLPHRCGLTKSQKPSTLRAHFTHAYRALDTLPNHYY